MGLYMPNVQYVGCSQSGSKRTPQVAGNEQQQQQQQRATTTTSNNNNNEQQQQRATTTTSNNDNEQQQQRATTTTSNNDNEQQQQRATTTLSKQHRRAGSSNARGALWPLQWSLTAINGHPCAFRTISNLRCTKIRNHARTAEDIRHKPGGHVVYRHITW